MRDELMRVRCGLVGHQPSRVFGFFQAVKSPSTPRAREHHTARNILKTLGPFFDELRRTLRPRA